MARSNRPPSEPTSGSSRDRPRKVQPPRPPNAWILYRSFKLNLIRETHGPLSQAAVSKIISQMWKHETEPVRRHFEREADDKKARHQQLYPDYRYSPQKREEKLRAKEESKQSRRAKKLEEALIATPTGVDMNATATMPATFPPMPSMFQPCPIPGYQPNMVSPHPYIQYMPEAYYGPGGPSPPISAAPSPVPYGSSESPESQPHPEENVASSSSSSSVRLSPCSESQASSSSSQLPPDSLYFSSLPSSHQPSPNSYVTQPLPTLLFQSSAPSELPLASPQVQFPPAEGAVVAPAPVFPTQPLGFNIQNSEEVVNFDIPINQTQNFAQFPQSFCGSSSSESFQGMDARTDENGLFDLGNVDTTNHLAQPQGDLDVAMGAQASTVDYNNRPFADFDFAAFQQMASFTESGSSSAAVASSGQQDLQALFHTPNIPAVQEYTTARQRQPSVFTQDMMNYLNFEAMEDATEDISTVSSAPVPTTVAPQQVYNQTTQYPAAIPIFNQMTNTPTVPAGSAYVPPAGAVHSSRRRVAASWKPPFAIPPSQVEQPMQPWTHFTS